MNLKNLLKNISEKINSLRFKTNSKTVSKIIAVCLVVMLIIVVAALVNRKSSTQTDSSTVTETRDNSTNNNDEEAHEKNEVEKKSEEYKNQLDTYNEAADNYNLLISGLVERKYEINQEDAENKEDYLTDSQKQDIAVLDKEIKSLKNETDDLIAKYDEKCIEVYNEFVSSSNAAILKYNAIIDKIGDYADLIEVEKKTEKSAADAVSQSWKKAPDYLKDLDDIIQEEKQISDEANKLAFNASNEMIKDYNIVADEYNLIVNNTVIDYIDGLPKKVSSKKELEESALTDKTEEELQSLLDDTIKDKDEIIGNYLIVTQITEPSEEWVIQRLNEISYITNTEAVTKENDPNGLLGKDGGYTSCVYFSVGGILQKDIPGDTIVAKGTDGGGAIEVYDSREHALNRCDYLSQFDGTILYSGSYTAIGTMVVRTSYKLNDEQQVKLTNSIITKFTEVK